MRKMILALYGLITCFTNANAQSYCSQTGTKTFSVNGAGQAGGIIFYDKGTFTNGWRFLERSAGPISTNAGWGCNTTSIPAASNVAIGTGAQNTSAILASCGTPGIAAHLCALYNSNGFNDWYMPSIGELQQIGGWGTYSYLSSSEYNSASAWYINSAGTVTWGIGNKSLNTFRIYAIRNVTVNQGTNKSIVNVKINTINKTSTKQNGYNDYTSTDSTKLLPLHSYSLSVNVNTAGTDTLFVSAYFDWNSDGDFNDPNETYLLGSAKNTINGQPTLSGLYVNVPQVTGLTRMRIITKKNGYASNCETGFDGEVEDYKIRIVSQVTGKVFTDNVISNCTKEPSEQALGGRTLIINPGNYVVQTNANGVWGIGYLPIGTYTITIDTVNNHVFPMCPINQAFNVTNVNNIISGPDFGIVTSMPCSAPEISIFAPALRRCSSQNIFVNACNLNTGSLPIINAYSDIELDSYLSLLNSSITYSTIGINKYRFQLGTINPGQCITFTVFAQVSCTASLGQTLCMQAELFPADPCVFDTIPSPNNPDNPAGPGGGSPVPCNLPWDQSSLSVNGQCQNDTVCFTITNTGVPVGGDMECYAPVRVYIDGVLTYMDSIKLIGGQTVSYCYPGNGQTWILQADQHPLHPGNSHPNAHVEACGNISNWTPGGINTMPLDDADPIVDIFCRQITGPMDPNDKTGYPTGLTNSHYIHPNQPLEYAIRFQNTGNDTAFTVIVRDTLDLNLNIFSVIPGVASHPYQFRMYGPRVLEWTFSNIQLPDSNINEPESHGFVTFHVNQNPNLSNGTVIKNDVDIYFDFNAPIITNETFHTINNAIQTLPITTNIKENAEDLNSSAIIYPNPTNSILNYKINDKSNHCNIEVYNSLGERIHFSKTSHKEGVIDLSKHISGMYLIIFSTSINQYFKKIIKH